MWRGVLASVDQDGKLVYGLEQLVELCLGYFAGLRFCAYVWQMLETM